MASSRQRRKVRKRTQTGAGPKRVRIEGADVAAAEPKGWLVATEDRGVCILFAAESDAIDIDFATLLDFPLLPSDARRMLKEIEFPLTSKASQGSICQSVGQSLPLANLGLQVAQGVYQARGLVQLGPETLAMLEGGARTIQSGAWNIGALAGPGGQFVGTVQWLPAGAAAPLAVAASSGIALTLMALQWQLGRIEKLAGQALAVGNEVLQEIRSDQRNMVAAKVHVLSRAVEEARTVGAVTDQVWAGFGGEGMETSLDGLRRNAEQRADRMILEFNRLSSARERGEWMRARGGELLADIITLIDSFAGLYRYWALRVAHILHKGIEEDRVLADKVRRDAKADLTAMCGKLAPQLENLWRFFSLTMECPGALEWWRAFGREKTLNDARQSAKQMRESLRQLYEGFTGGTLTEPPTPPRLRKELAHLRWFLQQDEDVTVALVDDSAFIRNKTLVATTHRLLVLDYTEFLKTGLIDRDFPVSSVRCHLKHLPLVWRLDIRAKGQSLSSSPDYAVFYAKNIHSEEDVRRLVTGLRKARFLQIIDQHPGAATHKPIRCK